MLDNKIVVCNNCTFNGDDNDLIKVVEFKNKNKLEYLPLYDFIKVYGDTNDNKLECEIIDGCPNCLTDSFLTDVY